MIPYIFERPDVCNNCRQCFLELYNVYNKPVGLSNAIDTGEINILHKLNVRYFKCKNCGFEFPIQWQKDGTPIPLTHSNIDLFMTSYKKVK